MTALRPTVLVFSRGALAERRCKRLLPGARADVEHSLHRSTLRATVATARAAGGRIVVAVPPAAAHEVEGEEIVPQRTDSRSFGARLGTAVAEIETRSPSAPLVVVGSDCPDLRSRHVRVAYAAIASDPNAVVLGPARDGGVYLIASARPLAPLFEGVRWRCRGTLESLARSIAARGRRVVLLERLDDVDTLRDLERWIARTRVRSRELAAVAVALDRSRTDGPNRTARGGGVAAAKGPAPGRAPPRAA